MDELKDINLWIVLGGPLLLAIFASWRALKQDEREAAAQTAPAGTSKLKQKACPSVLL